MVDKTKQQIPRPVRNQVAQAGEEVLVLRHQKGRCFFTLHPSNPSKIPLR